MGSSAADEKPLKRYLKVRILPHGQGLAREVSVTFPYAVRMKVDEVGRGIFTAILKACPEMEPYEHEYLSKAITAWHCENRYQLVADDTTTPLEIKRAAPPPAHRLGPAVATQPGEGLPPVPLSAGRSPSSGGPCLEREPHFAPHAPDGPHAPQDGGTIRAVPGPGLPPAPPLTPAAREPEKTLRQRDRSKHRPV
jgi:hypothetical protein